MTTMIPSTETISPGQIGKLQEDLAAALRKSGLPRDPVQQVIETQSASLNAEIIAIIRKHVDAVSNMIVRRVKVNRSQTPQQLLDATGRKQYTNAEVVNIIPNSGDEEVDVYFFKPTPDEYTRPGWMSVDDLDRCYDRRGLKVDPYAQGQVHIDDPAFADDRPNGGQWRDADGNACYVAFSRWSDGRRVRVHRDDFGWGDRWWFAGVRK